MKKLAITGLWLVSAAILSLPITTLNSLAAEWQPVGPIKMMIAFRAGGGADTQARMIAEELEARHGWKIIPEQVTGKGGAVMAAALKNELGDGTAIGMLVSESLGYNMIAAKNPGYGANDFTHITTTAGFQMGVVALTSKGWQSMDDVFAAAKSGSAIRFGVMSPRLADLAYLLGKANDTEFNIISYKGGKGVMNALNAGDTDIGWVAGIQAKAVQAGEMINLASGISEPLAVSPDAPLIKDLGVEFNADGYFMFVAPAGIPDEARTVLSKAIGEIVTDESTKAGGFIKKAFGGAKVLAGAELDNFMADSVADSKKLLQAASE